MGIIRRFIDFYNSENYAKNNSYNSERIKDDGEPKGYHYKPESKNYAYNQDREYRERGGAPKAELKNYPYSPERENGGGAHYGAAEFRSEPPKSPRAKKSELYLKDAFSTAGGVSTKGTRENDLLFEGDAKRRKALFPDELNNINMYYPRCFEDIVRLIDSVKQKEAVIVELCYLGGDMSQKMLDFMSGAIYALNGSMQRITGSAFLFAPSFVRITNNK
jgi:FtsZ-interacting cell division protein YlmF